MMFAYALTSPVVHIYFMKLVDPQVLAVANMLSVGLAAIVNATVTKDKFLSWYRKHFFWIVTLDIFSYSNFAGKNPLHPLKVQAL